MDTSDAGTARATSAHITFRRLGSADLPLLHRWLNEPGVVQWWEGDDVSWEGVVDQYGHAAHGAADHLALLDLRPIGWIQWWRATEETGGGSEADAWARAGIELDGLAGIDYLVGEPDLRGRGVGTAMISAFAEDVLVAEGFTAAAAGPYLANTASWRALAGAGFRHVADVVHDGDTAPCRLMCKRL